MPFIPDASARQRLQRLWDELQADLSHLSDNRRTVYLEKSGHFVQRDDPVVLEGAQIDLQEKL
jgi:hypothetical protein